MVMGVPERLDQPITIGDITLVAVLGEGGMASVYLGAVGEGALARPAAIKLLRPDLADPDYRMRFLDEAKVVVHLHHNNVVDVHRAGELEGQLYIAMECVNGRDLADIWDRCAEVGRAFPLPLAVHVIREVLRGLHYAHSLPGLSLVHRDVSPSNVLIDWAGAVRLADFGLATSAIKATMTVPGVVFGKVGYMSPEQARREALDGRSDVYACGAVLWELITGRSMRDPAERDTTRAATFQATPPSRLSRRVDAALDGIVVKALANDRNERYATAAAMMEDLSQWLVNNAPETSQESVAQFLRDLFGDAGDRERRAHEVLFADLRNSGPHRTRLLFSSGGADTDSADAGARVDTDELRKSRGGALSTAAGEIDTSAAHGQAPANDDDSQARNGEGDAAEGDGDEGMGEQREAQKPGVPSEVKAKGSINEYIPAGTVIAERYRVLSQLGRGGMGTVFLGEHVTVGRSVAIKVLTHHWSRNEAVAQRFRAEARAASAAGHPNIVEVFDAGELPDGRLYLVMEFLTGRNLFEEIEANGPMEVARACRVMRDVARAIRAAHEVGIIHRDLKPDNVMLFERGGEGEAEFVKVLDFGISANTEDQETDKRLTVPGSAIGTPEYMAPEQCKGKPATERFDIYALGVIFYEVLTGEPPIQAESFVELMAKKTTEASPSLAAARPDLPPNLVRLVDDCLALAPDDRPPTVRVFLARLEEVLRSLPRSGAAMPALVERDASREAAELDAIKSRADGKVGDVAGGVAGGGVDDLASLEHGQVAEGVGTDDTRRRGAMWAVIGFVAALLLGAGLWLGVLRSTGGADDQRAADADGALDGAALADAAPTLSQNDGAGAELEPTETETETQTETQTQIAQTAEPGSKPTVDDGAESETPAAAQTDAKSDTKPNGKGESDAGQGAEHGANHATGSGGNDAAAKTPAWATDACKIKRKRAADARGAGNWVALKRALDRSCYQDRGEYTRLRVKVLAELGDYAGCIKAGKGSSDPKVGVQVKICEKQLAG